MSPLPQDNCVEGRSEEEASDKARLEYWISADAISERFVATLP